MKIQEPINETAKEIAKESMLLLYSGKVRDHKLRNSSRIHTGEAEKEEYHTFRNFLPTKNACIVYNLTGSDRYE